jgi:peptidoglycan/LPS O-acetylase OafA/YrhL
MQKILPAKKVDENLEAIRGYAALFVVFCHLGILNTTFNRLYVPKLLIIMAPSGHIWVLVFFVLSGYVITISNKQSLTGKTIGLYLKKRFLRIYPIYVVALVIALLVSTNNYPLFNVLMNFSLMQVLMVPPFIQNGPAWSLHYEAMYYLLFVPVSFFRLKPSLVITGCVIIAFVNFNFYPNVHTPIISSYLFGYVFWLSGLFIAKYIAVQETAVDYKKLIASIFLLLCVTEMLDESGVKDLIDHASYFLFHTHLLYPQVKIANQTSMGYQDLLYLPFCIYAICIFSGRHARYHKYLYLLVQAIILVSLVIAVEKFRTPGIKNGHQLRYFSLAVAYYVISIIWPWLNFNFINKISQAAVTLGSWLGGISYAIYILHFPLIFAMGRIDFFYQNQLTYVVRFIVFMSVLIGLSYLLEKKLQPLIKDYFFRRNLSEGPEAVVGNARTS